MSATKEQLEPESQEVWRPAWQLRWESDPLEESLKRWQLAHSNHHFFNIKPDIEVEKNDNNAPDLPAAFIDTLLGLAKVSKYRADVPEYIKRVKVYHGGSLFSIRLEDENGKFTHIYFECLPPFDVRDLIKK